MSSYIFVSWIKFFTSFSYRRIFFDTKDFRKTPPFPREKPSLLLSRFAILIFFCTLVSRNFIFCIDLVCLNGRYQFSFYVSWALSFHILIYRPALLLPVWLLEQYLLTNSCSFSSPLNYPNKLVTKKDFTI